MRRNSRVARVRSRGARATHPIEIRRCDDEHTDAETVLCHASEEWPDLYCGVFAAEIALGGKRRHAEIDIRFDDGAREIGPVFLLCRYQTEGCADPRPGLFGDQPMRVERRIGRSASRRSREETTTRWVRSGIANQVPVTAGNPGRPRDEAGIFQRRVVQG